MERTWNEPSLKEGSNPVPGMIRPGFTEPLSRPGKFGKGTSSIWTIFRLAIKKYFQIAGTQWAEAFAFNAVFSLFPLIVLFVTIASTLIDQDRAGKEVIAYMQNYIPLSGKMQTYIFDIIAGVVKARGRVGAVAFLILVWGSLQCFITLISATNRAWCAEVYNWWRLPLKSLTLLGITQGAVLLGMVMPVLMRIAKHWLLSENDIRFWVDALGSFFIPLLFVFLGLSLFYRLAPRSPTKFAQVWVAALCATILLRATESLFVIYLKDFATLNAVYGAFGGIVALLLWIYLSGCILIFGACLCAAQAEVHSAQAKLVKSNC
jgi:YihY family inner membrane protein